MLLRDFQLLSPISTRHQAEFANSKPDHREFRPKTRIPRRLAPHSLCDVGRCPVQNPRALASRGSRSS